ncbi:MAG: TonB-dependent receptor, partial [Sphingobacteriales bacterium]
EKIHLHLDKPFYAIGEDIWFKVYVTVGPDHRLTALSGILNVELNNDQDSIKQSLKIPLTSGLGWGDFSLPDTLKEGNYRIRAYTNWMRNAGEDYFFDKIITILNAATNKVFTNTTFAYSLQNGEQKVSATINYTDINGAPYAGKEVSYRVEGDTRTIAKGKGITDDKGSLVISFDNDKPALFKSGRMVTVLNIADKEKVTKIIAIKAMSTQVDVQFFPESGCLVNGIGSKVAFKATGADGLGNDVKGVIKDEQGKTVSTFGSQHLGMGTFTLMPETGKTYKAHITYDDGSEKIIALPAAKDAGYILNIDNSNPAAVIVKVLATNLSDAAQVSLVAQMGGKLIYAAKSKAGTSTFTTAIPKSRFISGIAQFTLFSSAGEPLNERLVFIQKNDLLKLDVSTSKTIYTPREKIKLGITARTAKDSLVEGSFSVAVIDETKVNIDEADENTILSDILLTSELKGYIEKPNYYFTNINEKTQADLDILMLTQGYRRFEWKQLLNNNLLPAMYQPEKTLDITGTVTQKGIPLAGAKVTLFSSTGGLFSADTIADAQGRFKFKDLIFADSARMVVQATARNGKKTNLDITLDNITPALVTKNKNAPDTRINLNDGLAYLQYSKNIYDEQSKFGLGNRTIVLKEVVVKEKKQVAKNSSNLNGAGRADQVINFNKDVPPGCITLEQCLNGRLAGVYFVNGKPVSSRGGGTMLVVVDGAYMNNFDLTVINMNDVATVEVLRNISLMSIYGPQANNGVIIITTKRGEPNYDYLKRPAPGVISYSPKGYYVARAFYSPQYDDPKTNANLADMRSTIYWNPSVFTDKQGKASVEYFNAGSKGTYRVVIEGINNDGAIGRQIYRYKVE